MSEIRGGRASGQGGCTRLERGLQRPCRAFSGRLAVSGAVLRRGARGRAVSHFRAPEGPCVASSLSKTAPRGRIGQVTDVVRGPMPGARKRTRSAETASRAVRRGWKAAGGYRTRLLRGGHRSRVRQWGHSSGKSLSTSSPPVGSRPPHARHEYQTCSSTFSPSSSGPSSAPSVGAMPAGCSPVPNRSHRGSTWKASATDPIRTAEATVRFFSMSLIW